MRLILNRYFNYFVGSMQDSVSGCGRFAFKSYFVYVYHFHVSNSALFSTQYSSTLILHRRSLDTFNAYVIEYQIQISLTIKRL